MSVGTNQRHNINEIHNAHLYQSTHFFERPSYMYSFHICFAVDIFSTQTVKQSKLDAEQSLTESQTALAKQSPTVAATCQRMMLPTKCPNGENLPQNPALKHTLQ